MTNTQHTPGPWEITGHGSRPTPCTWVSLGDEDDGNSLEVVGDNHVANARLIEQAPAMLDLLRAIVREADRETRAFIEARAILAKFGGAECAPVTERSHDPND